MIEASKQILERAKACGLMDHLCGCLVTSGQGLISGSSTMLRAACEACKAIGSFIEGVEALFMKANAISFPVTAFRSCSLRRLQIQDHEKVSLVGTDSARMIDAFTRAFLRSKAVQVAVSYCLRQRIETSLLATIQILSRCCLQSAIIPSVLCGLPTSLPATTIVSGGGDGSIVSEIFSVLSLCASLLSKDSQVGETAKAKLANPSVLAMNSCLLLAIVAQCLKSSGRNSALFMLTTSMKKQQSRLSVLTYNFSSDDGIKASVHPYPASAMLALACILSLECGAPVESSISEVAVPLIPRTGSLCEQLKVLDGNDKRPHNANGALSCWHGLRDGCVGLLEARLRWGGPLAVQQLCASGIPLLLIELLNNNHLGSAQETTSSKDQVGVPSIILQCLEHVETKDLGRPVAFLAKMTSHKPLAVHLVGKGLLEPSRVKRLLDASCPSEVTLDILMIISDLSRMDKAFYEHIDRASVLEILKDFLIHEDPNIRAKTCSALGNMCRHSSYFYSLLIGNAAYYNDKLYDELRRSIPQLAYLLLSNEEDKTKANAAGALSNLVRNSNRLCDDIVSKGAMQALLKLVADCSTIALKVPNRRDGLNESPLKIALFSLAKMCAHTPCREFLRSSELFPVIGQLRQSPESTIANYATLIISKVTGG
ncbi:Serine/threonine-protein kinase TIO [Linum perenne]